MHQTIRYKILHINQKRDDLPNLSNDPRIAIFPLGGSTLKDWVTHNYLKELDIDQYHIYDLDDQTNPPYLKYRDEIRKRGGKNWAELTARKETENYLHPDAIKEVYGFSISFGEMDDVPQLVASIAHNNSESSNPWNLLSDKDKKKKANNAKRRLNIEVTKKMSFDKIKAADSNGDIIKWLEDIRDRIT